MKLVSPLTQPEFSALEDLTPPPGEWELTELSPKHTLMCSLLAQGESNKKIAALLQWCPEYISMLKRQPLVKKRIKEFAEEADTRLLALMEQSVEVCAEVMREGNHRDKLGAATLVMQANNRVGAGKSPAVVLNQKFVVHVPAKAASPADWVSAMAPGRVIDVVPEVERGPERT